MIRFTTPLVMAALGLIMSALTHTADGQTVAAPLAKATSIPISYLPYTITAPGTYVLTKNLTVTVSNAIAAIFIAANISGPVILNLKGFTISGGGTGSALTIGSPNQYPISVKNGTLANFTQGIELSGNDIALSGLTLSNIQGSITSTCINIASIANALSVRNCSFSNATYGIADASTNSVYSDLQFTNVYIKLFLTAGTLTVGRCSMESSN